MSAIGDDDGALLERRDVEEASSESPRGSESELPKLPQVVPPGLHADLRVCCDRRSYADRGWCRFELLVAELAASTPCKLLVHSATSTSAGWMGEWRATVSGSGIRQTVPRAQQQEETRHGSR